MAYLLTQILFCLALAALVGGAVGWILSGFRSARREATVRSELMRQSLALNQAETDNRMIEEDYRELKFRSEEIIAQLKTDNRQIPELNQNLEKSQTLIRQLLQKHEAELEHAQNQNRILASKLKEQEDRLTVSRKLQANLDAQSRTSSTTPLAAPLPASSPANVAKPATLAESVPGVTTTSATKTQVNTPKPPAPYTAAQPLATERQEHDNHQSEAADTVNDGFDLDSSEFPSVSTKLEGSPVESGSSEKRFEAAPHADDLKTVFGIGPKTELALNALGINTVAQVAALERDDIEFVAAELNIFPGKIEKENWVGSARQVLAEAESAPDLLNSSHQHDDSPDEFESSENQSQTDALEENLDALSESLFGGHGGATGATQRLQSTPDAAALLSQVESTLLDDVADADIDDGRYDKTWEEDTLIDADPDSGMRVESTSDEGSHTIDEPADSSLQEQEMDAEELEQDLENNFN